MKQYAIVTHYLNTDGSIKDTVGFDRTEARNKLAALVGNLWLEGAQIDDFGLNADGEKVFVVNDASDDAHMIWLEGVELPEYRIEARMLAGMVN